MNTTRVQVLDRALDLIELLATAENGLGITELSTATGLPKSTVHRILTTYCERHYIEKNKENSTYSLGHKFVEIASLYLNEIDLKTEASPIMREMAGLFGATAYLGVLENDEVVYLAKEEQFNSLRLYAKIGKREPIHCTALGKVLIAALPEDEFRRTAKELSYTPYTSKSITCYDDLAKEVDFVRSHGYALDCGEHTESSSCLAVPIYDYTRKVMAAMSISGHGLLENFEPEYIYEKMYVAAMDLSKRMGYTEAPKK